MENKIINIENEIAQEDKQLEEITSLEHKLMTEDLIVQENEWLVSMMEEKRKEEVRMREELFEKQKMLEERRKDQNEVATQTRQMQLYNQMHDDEQRDQIYALHGITLDKVEGMKEYKNALYQGSQIVLFVADLVICVLVALLYGEASAIFMACIALLAAQTTLLPREHHGRLDRTAYSVLSMILSFVPTVAIAGLFVIEKFGLFKGYPVLLIAGCVAIVLSLVGAYDYYARNPYREIRKAAREAKADYKALKKGAAKTVKKNQSMRAKMESRLLRKKEKQENKLERLKNREEERFQKAKRSAEDKAARLEEKIKKEEEKKEKYQEIDAIKAENKKKRKMLLDNKIVELKKHFKKDSDKIASGSEK